MISPSESWVEGNGSVARAVVPLEFEDLRELLSNEPAEALEELRAEECEPGEGDALAELEARMRSQAESKERQIEAVRQETRAEVQEELARELEVKISRERERVAMTCERFSKERARYFAEVEAEVVRLALAIATRVLHRETELDPLLLRGAVRVALEKVQEGGAATLRVPEGQIEEWNRVLIDAHRDDVGVVGDSRLQSGECVLETSVGRVDLGVKAQLDEIEKGFFDLLQQRPA